MRTFVQETDENRELKTGE